MWKNKSKPERLKGGQSACKPLHISPRVHLSKGPPVPPSASQVSSHRCSSWQRIWKERVVEGVDFRYILQGTIGRGPEGKREDVSWFHGTLSVVIYVPSKTNVQTKQPKTPSVSKVAAEPRCSRPLIYEIHPDQTIQTLQFTRQVSTSESNMQSSLPSAPFPSAGNRKEGSPLFVLIVLSTRRPVSVRQKSRHVKARGHKWGSDITNLFAGKVLSRSLILAR